MKHASVVELLNIDGTAENVTQIEKLAQDREGSI